MDRFSVNNGSANAGSGGTSTSGAVVNSSGNNAASIATATATNNSINNTGNNNANNNSNNNNNGVKLRLDRGNASIDSTLSSASASSSTVASVASSYRRSFHRLGPGSASATSDYSMSTLPESIQDEQHQSNGAGDAHTAHAGSRLQQLTGPPGSGAAGMASHNTSGLPGLLGLQNNSSLTQAGLEEYSRSYYEQTMYHHQKQSSYAQSEGYHSYVSSSDSSSTPFLDRLRQDSDLLLSRSSHNWSQQDLQQLSSSSNSIGDNNSSESTSSTETLKWLGSMSDVSEASHATSMSALSSAGSTSQLIAHSSRVRTPQRHNSESILFMTTEEQQQHQQQQQQAQHLLHQHQALLGSSHQSPAGVGLVSQSMGSLHHHHSHPHHHLNGSLQQGSPTSSSSSGGSPVGEDLRFQHRTPSNTSLASSASAPPGNGTGMSGGGNSGNNSIRSSRSNNRLFPISTYTEIPSNSVSSSNGSNINNSSNNSTNSDPTTPSGTSLVDGSKQLSPHNWQSVAERINELEKHQLNNYNNNNNNNHNNSISGNSNNANPSKNLSQHAAAAAPKPPLQQQQQQQQSPQKYTYFDPSKTHRVPNPSLKAFQKNAVISYFERQQAHARESNHNLSRPTTLNLHQQQQHSGSPPSLKSFSQRSSISSAYSSSGSTLDLTPSSQSPLVGNYHHHPSIVVQQQLDKIAANNLRNQLASVHTMNLLNKVQSPPSQQPTAQLIESQMISNASLILANDQNPDSDALDTNGSPPPPPPRSRSIGMPGISNNTTMSTAAATHAAHLATVRRTSSASEYSSIRDQMIQQRQQLSKDLLGPMIMGPIIALDDWVPERPPKNPMLRIPSPELPPPPPMMSPTEDVVLLNQDEPLPPPPPEILRHIRQLSDSGEPKSNTTSRRNSFAGQTNKKSLYRASTFENLSPPPPGAPPSQQQISQLIIPPAVPKKPQPMESQVVYRRPSSSMAKSQQPANNSPTSNSVHQAHRVVVNGKPDQRHSLPMQLHSPPQQFVARQSDARVSMRKRSHNSQQIPAAEFLLKAVSVPHHQNGQMIPVSTANVLTAVATSVNNNNNGGGLMMTSPPPPLKPRMSLQQQQQLQDLQNGGPLISMGSKRSNSKASYLPRQPRDKLHSDPDHGSYKLTLTSNEDSINHNDVFPEEIITSSKCNLPDVLPPGVKYSLYSNNNNNNNSNNNNNNNNNISGSTTTLGGNGKPIVGKPPKTIPHSAPIISTNSLKSMFNFTPQQPQQNQVTPPSASSPVTPPPAYKPSSSSPSGGSPTNQAISPKYTSQSTIDLKKTQILDSKYLFQQHQQCPAQIGLPPAPAPPPPPPPPCDESINNTNYLNHPHGGPNTTGCSQQTVNNCIEISEKSDSFESSISTGTTSTSTVEPVEVIQNSTNTSKIGAVATHDGFAAQEEEDSISSNNTSICAEANQSNPIDESLTVVALERVTKQINLEPVVETSEEPAPVKVVQRTEIVLRVAAPTSEASSQTDNELAASVFSSESNAPPRSPRSSIAVGIAELVIDHTGTAGVTTKHSVATSTSSSPPSTPTSAKAPGSFFSKACTAAPRKVHPEEIDCDKLSHDLISQLSPSDKLHTILAPKTFKSTSDYVSDLFNIQIAPRPMKKDASTATPEVSPQKSPLDILTTSSTYFQVSEPKAKLMTRYSREMTLINGDCCDLTKKKEELVQRLGKKLLVLSNEQTSIAEESNANDMLGNDVALKVAQKVRPTDASKFRSYVDDVGYITMLLLSLSGRLARTDNALHNIDDSHPDKKILEAKRDRLLEQLEEAKQLKDDIDRRGAIISKILEKSLTIEEYADYDYFINMKAKLIVDSREIADKIKLGEEQLAALKDTLVQSEC